MAEVTFVLTADEKEWVAPLRTLAKACRGGARLRVYCVLHGTRREFPAESFEHGISVMRVFYEKFKEIDPEVEVGIRVECEEEVAA